MSEWVRAEDGLPKYKVDYQLFCSDTGEQFVGFYYGEGRFQFGRYKDSVTDVLLLCRPRHFVALPDPPE